MKITELSVNFKFLLPISMLFMGVFVGCAKIDHTNDQLKELNQSTRAAVDEIKHDRQYIESVANSLESLDKLTAMAESMKDTLLPLFQVKPAAVSDDIGDVLGSKRKKVVGSQDVSTDFPEVSLDLDDPLLTPTSTPAPTPSPAFNPKSDLGETS